MRLRYLLLVSLALSLSGCGLLNKQTARTANDIARDLCELHARQQKVGISPEEIAETFCKDLRPWADLVLSLQNNGIARPAAQP